MTTASVYEGLMERYPALFRLREENPRYFLGFGCGEGWIAFIDEMCAKLSALEHPPRIVQIKQKFGRLRCYVVSSDDSPEVDEIIEEAYSQSRTVCEECGEPGSMAVVKGIVKCMCPKHHAELEKKLANRHNY